MSDSLYSNKQLFFIMLCASAICFLLGAFITSDTPEQKAKKQDREAIRICKANSVGKITDEVCAKMEDDFRLKYGSKP